MIRKEQREHAAADHRREDNEAEPFAEVHPFRFHTLTVPQVAAPFCAESVPIVQRLTAPARLDGMDDHSNCGHADRLADAEAKREALAADLMDAAHALERAELAGVRADRGYFAYTDAEPGSPEAEAARVTLAAALMDTHAALRRIRHALCAAIDGCAETGEALTAPGS